MFTSRSGVVQLVTTPESERGGERRRGQVCSASSVVYVRFSAAFKAQITQRTKADIAKVFTLEQHVVLFSGCVVNVITVERRL